jgi:hypothetical protein
MCRNINGADLVLQQFLSKFWMEVGGMNQFVNFAYHGEFSVTFFVFQIAICKLVKPQKLILHFFFLFI